MRGAKDIQDLTGLQYAINLSHLDVNNNQISDLSPIAGLIALRGLILARNPVSNISPLRGLTNLTTLAFHHTSVSDPSPIAGLINLRELDFNITKVSDISVVTGLTNLEFLAIPDANISDLSPIAGLTNLIHIFSWGNPLNDLVPLAGLTKLRRVDICGADLSDLTPLTQLPNLKELYLAGNGISDISPLARLTGVTRLHLSDNEISDISALAGLTNLTWLGLDHNKITNFSPLDGLRENIKLVWHANPGFPQGGPKIEGPWLWVLLPDTELNSSTDLLAEATGGIVTEVEVATRGAIEGNSVGDTAWTAHRLPPTGRDNIEDMLNRPIPEGVIYGSVSLYSPREQETTMYVGSEHGLKVWLNGDLIYENLSGYYWGWNYSDFFPVTLQQGRNVLLVAIRTRSIHANGFFGFEPGTEYTVGTPGVGYTFSKTPIHIGDSFTLDIRAENIFDLAGWQFDIDFDPAILEAISVTEGNFLKADGVSTFFHGGSIDNAAGKIKALNAARLSLQGATGTGTLLQVTFKAKSAGETQSTLQNFQFASTAGDSIAAGPHEIRIVVAERLATGDVNGDGIISILDMVLIVRQLGQSVPPGSPVDLNGDGMVSILDLIRVAQGIAGSSAAPPAGAESVDAATIEAWIAQARLEDDGSIVFKEGIEMLENLLASMIPKKTALLANYPNPFNPETWIPYHLAEVGKVEITIYDVSGSVVRSLDIGYQSEGYYTTPSRATYWDGTNELGETVASGTYFYTLTAGDFSATRKMLILK